MESSVGGRSRRPLSSDESGWRYECVSDAALTFVQQCQVAVLECAHEDYVAQVVSIWGCLLRFPKRSADADLLAAAIAVSRTALGFFANTAIAPCRVMATPRRRHAHAVLGLARVHFARSDLTLELVASELQLSVACLSRALNSETGRLLKSPFRCHLNGIRVLAAIEQMRSPATLNTIARAVGYPCINELDRQFDRWFGVAPRAFRACLLRDHNPV